MTKNPQLHGRAKHTDIRHHFVREQVSIGKVTLESCLTADMTADIFTKGLNREQYHKLRDKVGIHEMPSQ